jgi:hypothetical protein
MNPSIFIFAILFCFSVWFVFSPLLRNSRTDLNIILDNTPDSQKLLQQKRSELMLTLREMDFDYEMGKLSKEDYVDLKKKYESETIDILRQIDFEKSAWNKFQQQIDEKLENHRA